MDGILIFAVFGTLAILSVLYFKAEADNRRRVLRRRTDSAGEYALREAKRIVNEHLDGGAAVVREAYEICNRLPPRKETP